MYSVGTWYTYTFKTYNANKHTNIRTSLSFDQALYMVNIRAKETVDEYCSLVAWVM